MNPSTDVLSQLTEKLLLLPPPLQSFYKQKYVVEEKDIQLIRDTPQRTPEWFQAREGRLTASIFGSIIGVNPYETDPRKITTNIVYGSKLVSNESMERGTRLEPFVREVYRCHVQATLAKERPGWTVVVRESGLNVCKLMPFLGVSPDGEVDLIDENGVVQETFLLEIKVPGKDKLYGNIPTYYYAQIQGIMAVLGYKRCHFAVFTPSTLSIEEFAFDDQYVNEYLLPGLIDFFFDEILPRMMWKEHGLISDGQLDLVESFDD